MHLRHVSVADFRSYESADLALGPGVTTLVGLNGQGKTNLVEAVGYLSSLGSHRVSTDAPLVRAGAERAIIRAAVIRQDRETMVEIEIHPGRTNRARLARAAVSRPRDLLGTLRTVLFAPEDLALVDLLVARQPRWSGVRADLDRILKQRSALLKSAAPQLRRSGRRSAPRVDDGALSADREAALVTLDVWNSQLAMVGSQLLYARLRLLRDLTPHLTQAYAEVSGGQGQASVSYRSTVHAELAQAIAAGEVPEVADLHAAMVQTMAEVRDQEIERAVNLVGPHRDDLLLTLGDLPAKGYASHGESWSFALGLKLAAYHLLRHDLGEDPVLILDDVFAELDQGRRQQLAELVGDAEQVLVTAAVPEDVPTALVGRTYAVSLGCVQESP